MRAALTYSLGPLFEMFAAVYCWATEPRIIDHWPGAPLRRVTDGRRA